MNELPLACDMTALSAAQRERQQVLMKQFHASVQETQGLGDGYAFRLEADAETILRAAEFITIERLCCPFLNFELEVGPAGSPVWLRLTGRAGVKQFIEAEFGAN
ncbi:MAG TPA: hypothetical protein VE842_10825 [Pyrinomonadaceae bacterium]|nr:hypothetical protein [Pyrinomonadaceae bacterium]